MTCVNVGTSSAQLDAKAVTRTFAGDVHRFATLALETYCPS